MRLRLLFAICGMFVFAVVGIATSSSCVVDYRMPDGGMDGMVEAEPAPDVIDSGPPPEEGGDCGCCVHNIVPLAPPCSGKEAFEIAGGDCPMHCKRTVAYALCVGTCYTTCACELPAGYTIIDGGGGLDSQPADTGLVEGGDGGDAADGGEGGGADGGEASVGDAREGG